MASLKIPFSQFKGSSASQLIGSQILPEDVNLRDITNIVGSYMAVYFDAHLMHIVSSYFWPGEEYIDDNYTNWVDLIGEGSKEFGDFGLEAGRKEPDDFWDKYGLSQKLLKDVIESKSMNRDEKREIFRNLYIDNILHRQLTSEEIQKIIIKYHTDPRDSKKDEIKTEIVETPGNGKYFTPWDIILAMEKIHERGDDTFDFSFLCEKTKYTYSDEALTIELY